MYRNLKEILAEREVEIGQFLENPANRGIGCPNPARSITMM